MVGISSTSDAFHISRRIAENIREYNKNIIVIIGGPHIDEVNFYLDDNVNNPLYYDKAFDFAIAGDGEYMLLKLMRLITEGQYEQRTDNIEKTVDRAVGKQQRFWPWAFLIEDEIGNAQKPII